MAVAKRGVDVGCRMTGVELESCRVELYANVKGDAVASRRVLVGEGIVEAGAQTHKLSVRVVDRAALPAKARRTLRALAARLGKGTRVRIVGHTDASASSASYLEKLGLRRAKTVRSFLAARGSTAKTKVASSGATRPRATNRTDAGRATNRRVVLTIVR